MITLASSSPVDKGTAQPLIFITTLDRMFRLHYYLYKDGKSKGKKVQKSTKDRGNQNINKGIKFIALINVDFMLPNLSQTL